MVIKFIREDDLLSIKSNLPHLLKEFGGDNNSWIEEYFSYDPFVDSKYKVKPFNLDMSEEHPFLTELENVKRLYSSLRFLSDSEASDERLWAGMCLTYFWDYTQYRWNIKTNSSVTNIANHFFFGYGARRSLTRNAISRLWWIGRLTYDETHTNKYELTEYVCRNSDNIMHILERNTSNNFNILKPFLRAVLNAEKEGITLNTDMIGELSKYLNLLGGTYILDFLDPTLIYSKISKKIKQLVST